MPNPYYRTPDPYERVNINQLAKINQQDPWFGLGYALAQGWNRAYNQRGVDKSVAEIEKSLGPTEQERENAKNTVLNAQPTIEEDYNQLNQYLDDTLRNGNGYIANPTTANTFNNAEVPAGSLYSAAQNQSNGVQNQPSYNFGVGDARAYETSNAQAINSLANAQAADRLRNFDINQWQSQQRANLVKQGRSPEQIEAAMAVMMPQAQALDERNKDLDTQDALAKLGNLDLSSGYDPQAYQLIGRLSSSNPELATMLARDIISPRDEYEVNAQIAAQNNSLGNSIKLEQARDQIGRDRQVWENNYTVDQLRKMGWNDRDIATYMAGSGRSNSGSKTGTRSLIGSKEFEFANETINNLLEKRQMEGLTPQEEQNLANMTLWRDNAVNQSYGFNYPSATSGNTLQSMLDSAIAQGATKQQLLDEMTGKGFTKDDPEYQQAEQYLNSIFAGRQYQPQSAVQQQQAQQPSQQEDSSFDWSWINPSSPLLQPDANGNPRWINELNSRGIIGFGNMLNQMNQGENGMPYWSTNK